MVKAEHHVLYQYNLVGASNHYLGLIQTETVCYFLLLTAFRSHDFLNVQPYFQPTPAAPSPFSVDSAFNDPTVFPDSGMAWAVRINTSQDILIFGAGLYSFFQDWNQACLDSNDCQSQIFDVDSASSGVSVYSLSTVAAQFMLSVDENGIVDQSANRNGFQSTLSAWTLS